MNLHFVCSVELEAIILRSSKNLLDSVEKMAYFEVPIQMVECVA